MSRNLFTSAAIELIRAIPEGNICTYGKIAAHAGDPRGARQVVRILHSCGEKERLPWHRVVNREGRIALRPMEGYEKQRALLEHEGVEFDEFGRIDLDQFLWEPDADWLDEQELKIIKRQQGSDSVPDQDRENRAP